LLDFSFLIWPKNKILGTFLLYARSQIWSGLQENNDFGGFAPKKLLDSECHFAFGINAIKILMHKGFIGSDDGSVFLGLFLSDYGFKAFCTASSIINIQLILFVQVGY